jgi:hypothetical protein
MLVLRVSLPVLKHLFNVGALAEYLWSPPATEFTDDQRRERVELIKSFVGKGGRVLVSGNCLARSLMLYSVLSRGGARPTLVLGARKDDSRVAGHAWVEIDGESLFDTGTHAYTPVVALNGRAPGSGHLHSLI